MNTKEAIRLLNIYIEYPWSIEVGNEDANKFKKIIALLQRGEKFEKMWKELENKDIDYKTDSPYVNDQMYYIEQKYFPKEK